MPDFRSLEAFYWVAQLASFRRAAERLNMTQSAVSQRVAALEVRLGVRLLDRGPRTAALTPKGRQVMEHTERLLRLRADLLSSVAAPDVFSGTLRLGVSETIVHTWLARFVERAHTLYPLVKLDIEVDVTPRLRQGLIEQELDLAFLLGPVNEPRVLNLELCRYPLSFVRSPRLPMPPDPVPLSALLQVPIITYPRTTAPYIQVEQSLRQPHLPAPRVFGNSSLSTIVRMTLDRIGVSVIPPIVIRREVAYNHLQLLRTEIELPELVFTASYSATPDNPVTATLAQLARAVAADHRENDKGF